MQSQISSLADKIAGLAPTQRADAERYVEALQRDPHEDEARFYFSALSKASFASVWNNPDDDVYDAL